MAPLHRDDFRIPLSNLRTEQRLEFSEFQIIANVLGLTLKYKNRHGEAIYVHMPQNHNSSISVEVGFWNSRKCSGTG